MKETILKVLQDIIGKGLGGFILRLVIALIMLATGAATDFGDALGVALNKDRSIAAAVELINDTPTPEIVKAVAEEKVDLPE